MLSNWIIFNTRHLHSNNNAPYPIPLELLLFQLVLLFISRRDYIINFTMVLCAVFFVFVCALHRHVQRKCYIALVLV